MEYVVLFMIQFTSAVDVPKISVGRVRVGLEECRSWIRELEPVPPVPGRRAYCAKIKNAPPNECWYTGCKTNFG